MVKNINSQTVKITTLQIKGLIVKPVGPGYGNPKNNIIITVDETKEVSIKGKSNQCAIQPTTNPFVSNNGGIVKVDKKGGKIKITGIKPGSATIIVSKQGYTSTITVDVKAKRERIKAINVNDEVLFLNSSVKMRIKATKADGSTDNKPTGLKLYFVDGSDASNNPLIQITETPKTGSGEYLLTSKKKGKGTFIMAKNGVASNPFNVKVLQGEVPEYITIEPERPIVLNKGEQQQLSLRIKFQNGEEETFFTYQ